MTDAVALVPARRPTAWRRTIGALLRRERERQGLRLTDVAREARLSPQYLSEVERGLKEPSSEVLAALTEALGLTLVDLAQGIVDALAAAPGAVGDRPVLVLTSSSHGRRVLGSSARSSAPSTGPTARSGGSVLLAA